MTFSFFLCGVLNAYIILMTEILRNVCEDIDQFIAPSFNLMKRLLRYMTTETTLSSVIRTVSFDTSTLVLLLHRGINKRGD